MRLLSLAAWLVLMCSGASGCATPYDPRAVEAREAAILRAHERALHAESAWKRKLWAAEYERRVDELERYRDRMEGERAARAAHWRELSLSLQEAALIVLQDRVWRTSGY